jgi:hypothetical protein
MMIKTWLCSDAIVGDHQRTLICATVHETRQDLHLHDEHNMRYLTRGFMMVDYHWVKLTIERWKTRSSMASVVSSVVD